MSCGGDGFACLSPVIRIIVDITSEHAERALSLSWKKRVQLSERATGLTFGAHHCYILLLRIQ